MLHSPEINVLSSQMFLFITNHMHVDTVDRHITVTRAIRNATEHHMLVNRSVRVHTTKHLTHLTLIQFVPIMQYI